MFSPSREHLGRTDDSSSDSKPETPLHNDDNIDIDDSGIDDDNNSST